MTRDAAEPIGLLGGSFDPIHVGHLQLARDAAEQLGLARVLFLPAGLAWQKGPAAPAMHRARMVELSIATQPRFALDRRELRRPGPSFTVDTLRELRQEVGGQRPLVLLLGADQFHQLDTWSRWEQLIELAHLGVAARAGHALRLKPALATLRNTHLGNVAELTQRPAGVLVDVTMTPIECSSSQLRSLLGNAALRADPWMATMLAPGVLDYIRQHDLYA
jgi:nicotinate-nucleotide adenylyltransferase